MGGQKGVFGGNIAAQVAVNLPPAYARRVCSVQGGLGTRVGHGRRGARQGGCSPCLSMRTTSVHRKGLAQAYIAMLCFCNIVSIVSHLMATPPPAMVKFIVAYHRCSGSASR